MVRRVKTHSKFDKHYRRRILPSLSFDASFKERMNLFISDSKNPLLKDHPLIGKKKHLRSFSITGDIRVIYQEISSEEIILIDIGTHNQVY